MSIKLRNNTTGKSKLGLTAKIDPKNPLAFIYAPVGETNILGVVGEEVARYEQCEILTSGTVRVMVADMTVQGAVIRAQKSSDNISQGFCKTAKSTDVPYFKIGTALESGKGLIKCNLHFSQMSGGISVTDGTYTVGLGMLADGTITIVNGVITAIQEAT